MPVRAPCLKCWSPEGKSSEPLVSRAPVRQQPWGHAPPENVSDFNFLTLFSLVSESFRRDIGQLHSPRADESLQIGRLLHPGQFSYCSGYGARRVQTIFKINLEIFIVLKIYLLWKTWPIHVNRSVETGVDPRLWIKDYTISLPFCFKELPAENKWIWAKWPVWISLIGK